MDQLSYEKNSHARKARSKPSFSAQHEEQRNSPRATAALHTGKNITD